MELLSEKWYCEALPEVFNDNFFLRLIFLENNLMKHKQFHRAFLNIVLTSFKGIKNERTNLKQMVSLLTENRS